MRTLALATALAALVSGQDLGPKSEPAAMSSNYNPLVWRGDDAQFAVNTEHTSYCQAEFSKQIASKITDNDVLSVARLSSVEHEKLYRKLRSIAKALGFEYPPKSYTQSCPEVEKAQSVAGIDLQKVYFDYLRNTNKTAIQQFEAEVARPEKPDNYSLRKLAQKELPVLEDLQTKLAAPVVKQ